MRWDGSYRDGSPSRLRGMMADGVRDGRIAWARLYMEPVEVDGTDIDASVRELYRPPQ